MYLFLVDVAGAVSFFLPFPPFVEFVSLNKKKMYDDG
jgi:hypothetical protein